MVEKTSDEHDEEEKRPVMPNPLSMLSPDDGEKTDRMGFIRKVFGILAA